MDLKTAILSVVLFGLAMNNIFLGISFGIDIGVAMCTAAVDKKKKPK
ncbi:hypothetical protein FPV24_02920 [Carnobacterium sp. PL24RED07]|nr:MULTISPECIES: hypothetical protein [unclassified Carnobacterium]KAF3303372.1 hypothetical protein FPV22_02915 [Carnobacterium sp. PL26RED25]KAF3306656.1 hypothetical protein FPV24_02920 [Carnobacterium sp. PL24RED07]